ncbi:hypothetical protein [Streptomyces sp. NPDC086777]|uniref:hypothetical protein n=1 Tax=Streptomyces sp. NPDC086777 TaxID=3154866 RepID=UPI00344D09DC
MPSISPSSRRESAEPSTAVPLGVPHESNEGNRARLLGGDPSLVIRGPPPVA